MAFAPRNINGLIIIFDNIVLSFSPQSQNTACRTVEVPHHEVKTSQMQRIYDTKKQQLKDLHSGEKTMLRKKTGAPQVYSENLSHDQKEES